MNGKVVYTRELLAEAVANSTSVNGVVRYLGLRPAGGRTHISRRIKHYGIDTSHFTYRRGMWQLCSEQRLAEAAARHKSIAATLRDIGIPVNTSTHRWFIRAAAAANLDTRHFTGPGHRAGRTFPPRMKAEEYFVRRPEGSTRPKPGTMRRMLRHVGREERCAGCGTGPEWHGRPMTLEVDHIDGDWLNNTLENLRFLCPNCHATTPTYCGRNKGSDTGR
ncbi:HNH endonuclease [Streptacidiphilus monticola]